MHQGRTIDNLEMKVRSYIDKYNVKCKDTPMLKGQGILKIKDDEE